MFSFAWLILRRRNEERRRAERRLTRRHIRDHSDPFDVPAVVFIKLYRLSKETVHFIIESLKDNLNRQRRHGIPVSIKVLSALHFFGHGGHQNKVGQGHLGLSQPSVSKCLQEVVDAILEVLLNRMVVFPDTEVERSENKRRFSRIAGFPGVLGIIDCMQIAIIRPKDTEDVLGRLFFNREGFYSLNCQFVCNASMEIIHVNAKFPGSTHDSEVLQGSDLSGFLDARYVNGTANNEWLLGDSEYAPLPWLMTPHADPVTDSPEWRYNIAHSVTTVVIENCFSILKTRFQCLLKHRILHYEPIKASKIIAAVVVLHNLSIKRNDLLPEEASEIEVDRGPVNVPPRNVSFPMAARNVRDDTTRKYFM